MTNKCYWHVCVYCRLSAEISQTSSDAMDEQMVFEDADVLRCLGLNRLSKEQLAAWLPDPSWQSLLSSRSSMYDDSIYIRSSADMVSATSSWFWQSTTSFQSQLSIFLLPSTCCLYTLFLYTLSFHYVFFLIFTHVSSHTHTHTQKQHFSFWFIELSSFLFFILHIFPFPYICKHSHLTFHFLIHVLSALFLPPHHPWFPPIIPPTITHTLLCFYTVCVLSKYLLVYPSKQSVFYIFLFLDLQLLVLAFFSNAVTWDPKDRESKGDMFHYCMFGVRWFVRTYWLPIWRKAWLTDDKKSTSLGSMPPNQRVLMAERSSGKTKIRQRHMLRHCRIRIGLMYERLDHEPMHKHTKSDIPSLPHPPFSVYMCMCHVFLSFSLSHL